MGARLDALVVVVRADGMDEGSTLILLDGQERRDARLALEGSAIHRREGSSPHPIRPSLGRWASWTARLSSSPRARSAS